MRKRTSLLIAAVSLLALIFAACEKTADHTAGGQSITDTRKDVFGAEGLFKKGQSAAEVESLAAQNDMEYRKVEVEEFLGGTLNRVVVVEEPNQPYLAYLFLPVEAGGRGEMVIVDRSTDFVDGVLAWECVHIQGFIEKGGVTDFSNEFC
jgi:predicted small secreted protein